MTTIKIHPNLTKEEVEDSILFIRLLQELYWDNENELNSAINEKLRNSRVSMKDLAIQLVNLSLLALAIEDGVSK